MKKINVVICIVCLLLVGCKANSSYQRKEGVGTIVDISLQDVDEKMRNKESFVLVFAQDYCGYCLDFHKMLNTYLKNHPIEIFEVNLSKEEKKIPKEQILSKIQVNFQEFNVTPGIFYVEDGEKKAYFKVQEQELSETAFDMWIQKYQIDKVIK